ncbi:MAG: hypothetical protein ACYCPD_14890 [Acidobacteriaceae bacterium]
MQTAYIEQISINFEYCSSKIDNCSTAFDFECRPARGWGGCFPNTAPLATQTLSGYLEHEKGDEVRWLP